MNILICDDELLAAEKIADLVSHFAAQRHLAVSVVLWQESDYVSHVPNFNCTATKIIKTVCFSLHNNYII